MSVRKSVRDALSVLIASALVLSGALLTAPAASAEEQASDERSAAQTIEEPAEKSAPEEDEPEESEPKESKPEPEESADEPEPAPQEDAVEEQPDESDAPAEKSKKKSARATASGEPRVSVEPATGLTDGDEVTVTGTGYDPDQAIYVTTCTDVPLDEVDFDFINDGCTDGAKLVWHHGANRGLEFDEDGSFELTMDLVQREGSTALYTIANHTAQGDRSQDAKATLEFANEGSSGPSLEVSPATGLTDGDEVRITGTGFNPDQAIYVTTCTDVPLDEVDFDFINDGCTDGAELVWHHGANRGLEFDEDGSFELTMDLVQREGSTALYTIANHTAQGDRSQDAKATLEFESDGSDPGPDPSPGANVAGKVVKVTPGKSLDVRVTASELPGVPAAYVAVIEKGTEDSLADDGNYPAMEPFAKVSAGKMKLTLGVHPTKVDRNKQYEVIVWKQHSNPSESTIYGRADINITKAQWDRLFSVKPEREREERPAQRGDSQQAGSLTWGVSSGFAGYATGSIAKGSVQTSGVGGGRGGYVFPQASGGSWDEQTQTGTVRYSGVVTFTGHNGAMSESFSNPVIRITGESSGTITAGGHKFTLNLGAGSKSVGSNGEVTWSGVPLQGAISGGGGGGGGSFGADPVTFTVGAASGVSYGSTSDGDGDTTRTAADSAPTTTGIRIITPEDEIAAGDELEFEAAGFEPGERDALVVLYGEDGEGPPIVLDEAAGAGDNGTVRWIGELPEDTELGEHVITVQGSVDAGAVIEVIDPDEVEEFSAFAASGVVDEPVAAGIVLEEGAPTWVWWAAAMALLVVAGGMSGLVVAQRRAG